MSKPVQPFCTPVNDADDDPDTQFHALDALNKLAKLVLLAKLYNAKY